MRLTRSNRNWDLLGRRDPMWAILKDPAMRGHRWDPEKFFATGRTEIDEVLRRAEKLRPGLLRARALDFGCGAGRLTQALANEFEHTVGVDAAPSMIALAEKSLPDELRNRCEFVLNEASDLGRFAADEFDLVYTRIVLQHIPAPWSDGYVREFVRVLRPGGLAIFQVPSTRRVSPARWRGYVPQPVWDAWYTAKGWVRLEARSRMYGLPRERVDELVREAGGELLEAADDDSAPGWFGYSYAITK